MVPFNQLKDETLELAGCEQPATKVARKRTRLVVSRQFDLDAMELTHQQKTSLANLLDDVSDISSDLGDIGRTGIVKHRIDSGNHPPIKQVPRLVPVHEQEVVCEHVKEMLQHRVVCQWTSSWAVPECPGQNEKW